MTSESKAAARFYARIIGWKMQTWPEDPSYKMFVAPTGPMAGLMTLPEEAKAMGSPPCWTCYIGTPDVDATARLATKLGGTVLRAPADIPSVGRFAVLQDPQGAVFLVFTPLPRSGPERLPRPALGDFSWHELATTDVNAALDFYGELFGWEKAEAMDMGPMGVYQMYGIEGTTLGGMYNKPKDMPFPAHWLPYILVPDAKKAAAAMTRAGGKVISGPMEVPGGDWVAEGFDPQGALFAVHSRLQVATPKPAARKPGKPKKAARAKAGKKPAPARESVAAKKAAARKKAAKRPSAARKKSATRKKSGARKPTTRKRAARS
jgi:hypothetical protein